SASRSLTPSTLMGLALRALASVSLLFIVWVVGGWASAAPPARPHKETNMKRLLVIAALALPALPVAWADDKKADSDNDGWVQLFDGKSLKGWKTHPKNPGDWKVEKGILVGRGKASHLFSEKEYVNFHFRIKAMINDKGNSGQYFRTKFGPGFPKGYEAQINATHSDPIRTGSLYPDGRTKLKDHRKEIATVMNTATHKPDEFFTQHVVAVGPHITIT